MLVFLKSQQRRARGECRRVFKRNNTRLLKSLVGFLKSDRTLSSSPFGLGPLKKRRVLEKAERYQKSDYHLYGSMISPPKLSSLLKGHVQYPRILQLPRRMAYGHFDPAMSNKDTPKRRLVVFHRQHTVKRSLCMLCLSSPLSACQVEDVVKPMRVKWVIGMLQRGKS